MRTNFYKVELNYAGRQASISTAPCPGGWSWQAVVDDRIPLEGNDCALPFPETAIVAGKVAVEDFIDSGRPLVSPNASDA